MKIKILLSLLLCLIPVLSLGQGFDENYEVRKGDINGDGLTDLYVRRKPQVVILHGDIATPIVMPAPVKEFVLRQQFNGGYTIVSSLTPFQRNQVLAWPVSPELNVVTTDINLDGYRDIFIRGIEGSSLGAYNVMVYAPDNSNTGPNSVKVVDSNLKQFAAEAYGWMRDSDYFELKAIENGWYRYDGEEATGWWYIGYINFYYAYANGEKRYLDEDDDPEDINNIPAYCYDFSSACRFNTTYGFWQVYGTYRKNIEVVFDYENFNQDAIQLAQANPNSPSKIEQKIEDMMNEEFGGVFSDLILHEENIDDYDDDAFYGDFQRLLESQATLHNMYCVFSETNCAELQQMADQPGVDILVERVVEDSNYTQGIYRVMGETCQYSGNSATGICGYTMEREGPDSTVAGSNKRVSAGTYPFSLHDGGKWQNVPGLKIVPGRSAILIHNGSYPYHSSGCILIGKNLPAPNMINGSLNALNELRTYLNLHGFYGTVSIENDF